MVIFFDLDGTLIDIQARHYHVYEITCSCFGGDPLPQPIYWRMKRAKKDWSTILRRSKMYVSTNAFLKQFNRRIEEKANLTLDSLFPYSLSTLEHLRDCRYHLFLVTSRRNQNNTLWQLRVRKLLPLFEKILITPPDIDGGKASAMKKFSTKNSLVVGDTEEDIHAALSLHLPVLGVLSGIRNLSSLRSENPTCIKQDIRSLPSLLRLLSKKTFVFSLQ